MKPRVAGLLLCLALVGCGRAPADLPTPFATEYLPTAIALTVQAAGEVVTQPAFRLDTPAPSAVLGKPTAGPALETPARTDSASPPPATPTAPLPSATPTRRLTPTPTATPTPEVPAAAIQIFSPGPQSKVVSPIALSLSLRPGSSGRVQLELLGEDGRLLVREVIAYRATSGARVGILRDLEFEIPAVAEAGRLVVSTEDAQGRTVALASVDLILMAVGENDVNPAGNLDEMIIIREPTANKLIQGGNILVSGMARTASDQPLLVELVAADGQVVGYRQAFVLAAGDQPYASFSVEVPYQVSAPTRVRLVVKANAGRIPGVTHLSSLEVLVSP